MGLLIELGKVTISKIAAVGVKEPNLLFFMNLFIDLKELFQNVDTSFRAHLIGIEKLCTKCLPAFPGP